MAKKITRSDIEELLRVEGFTHFTKDSRVIYEHAASKAVIMLAQLRPGAVANRYEVQLLRRSLVDFGHLTEEEFAKWAANPKQFQAA